MAQKPEQTTTTTTTTMLLKNARNSSNSLRASEVNDVDLCVFVCVRFVAYSQSQSTRNKKYIGI